MKNKQVVAVLWIVLLSFICAYPLLVTVTNSFMTQDEITSHYSTDVTVFDLLAGRKTKNIDMQLIPTQASIEQYQQILLYQPSYLILLTNSIKITLPVVAGNIIVSLFASYGFCVWRFKYKEVLFYCYIIVMLMPLQAVLVPNYIIAHLLHIEQNYLAIILPGIFAPFGTFLLRQNMKAIPKECFEAADIDGAGKLYTFIHVVMPQMKSAISALAILTFIEYWNLVEQAVLFIRDYRKEPLSVFLSRMTSNRIGLVFAASCIYLFLPLWFLLHAQKDLEKGIELSGLK